MDKFCFNPDKEFKAIKVTGFENQFGELKRFCKDNIRITFETCEIDDYWCIKVFDCAVKSFVVVPDSDWIVEICPGMFRVFPSARFHEFFLRCGED